MAALTGGGLKVRPGEVSLAHLGVLFLDELPEFQRAVLDSLRQPLETGEVTVARANAHVTFPARVQLIAAMNPCRCGHLGDAALGCSRAPRCGADYQSKVSGPLLDRIDLHVDVPNLPADDVLRAPAGEASADMRARCVAARERALVRQGKTNQALVGQEIDLHAQLDSSTSQFLRTAAARMGWSARGTHRTLKIARTIADLAGSEAITLVHAAEAMQYRQSGPSAL